ncbi:hypothetical protein AURDEDRAFT_166204 [Auricularia subglabra TFB-10046 SS5]|nr:hypothetical protein AURDEDRAFT_166204 [Auricularia subglabra TFB-10046 SS5]
MAKGKAGTEVGAASVPRRSSHRGAAVQDESPVQEVAPRGASTRTAGAKAVELGEGSETPRVSRNARARPATAERTASGHAAARSTLAGRRRAQSPEQEPPLHEEAALSGKEDDVEEDNGTGDEDESPIKARSKRKKRISEATRKRKARAAALSRARAANQLAGENDEVDGEPDAGDDAQGPLSPTPPKQAAEPLEDVVSDLDEGAFIWPRKPSARVKAGGRKPPVRKETRSVGAREVAVDETENNELNTGTDIPEGQGEEDGVENADGIGAEELARSVEDEPMRPGVRRHTKAVQKEMADAARAGALEDLGAHMLNMLGQLKNAGVPVDFSTAAIGANQPVASPEKPRAYSRVDNFKGDGSSRDGKPVTEGRKYGAVFGAYDPFEVGLNVSDYSRKNNDSNRDNTELFYPLVRKGYAMNRYRESYIAIIVMPVSGDLKGQTYAWGSPRLLQDLPEFLDDCALEISHGTMDKRAHGYAKALTDYKRKALKDLAELNRKNTAAERGEEPARNDPPTPNAAAAAAKRSGPAGQVEVLMKTPKNLPATPDVGQKRKRAKDDEGEEERAGRVSKIAKVADVPPAEQPSPRRPFTPRNASSRAHQAAKGRG